MELKVS